MRVLLGLASVACGLHFDWAHLFSPSQADHARALMEADWQGLSVVGSGAKFGLIDSMGASSGVTKAGLFLRII